MLEQNGLVVVLKQNLGFSVHNLADRTWFHKEKITIVCCMLTSFVENLLTVKVQRTFCYFDAFLSAVLSPCVFDSSYKC